MPKLFMHIGVAKTGTSALQAAFAKNIDQLLAHNIVYPAPRSLEAARAGRITSGNGKMLVHLISRINDQPTAVYQAYRDIEEAVQNGHDILYSSEALLTFNPSDIPEFRQFLAEMGCELRIVAYVRSIADHALSSYHQNIKSSRVATNFAEFVTQHYRGPQRRIIRAIDSAFDKSEIIIRNYDSAASGLFSDFLLNVLGLKSIDGFIIDNARVNRSLSDFEIALMRAMNRILDNPRHGRAVSDALIYGDGGRGRSNRISSDAMQAIERLYTDDVNTINRHLPDDPIGLKSSKLEVTSEPERELTEEESVFAYLIASVIRANDVEGKPDKR